MLRNLARLHHACLQWNLNGDSSYFPDLSFMTERACEQCVSVQFVFSSDQLVFNILCVEWWQWKEWAGPWPYSGFQFCCLSPVDKPDSSKGVPYPRAPTPSTELTVLTGYVLGEGAHAYCMGSGRVVAARLIWFAISQDSLFWSLSAKAWP